MSRYIDLKNQLFGKLTVISFSHISKARHAYWNVVCECGINKVISGNNLRMGNSESCGCQQIKQLEKGRIYFKGKKRPDIAGKNCHLWRGGITQENMAIRKSLEYKEWRNSVFKRDNFICQNCKQRGGELQADHIIPFSICKEKRLDINNGRTLCKECHKKTETWGEKAKKYQFNMSLLA